MEDPIRVLIADDHPLFRDGMRGLLGSLPDMEVVGEASSGEQAMALARELQPDVILMDIKMPGINGIEATREILHISPRIGVVVVTMFEDDDSVFAAMRAGARGYLLKGSGGGARDKGRGQRRSSVPGLPSASYVSSAPLTCEVD